MAEVTESMPAVLARGLTKTFASAAGRVSVLREADLSVAKGETVAVVGASGIGKSTLLHILGTLDTADAGTLALNGSDVTRLTEPELARFRNATCGFVFQFHHLLAEFTALENTALPALIAGRPRSEALDTARVILDRVGLAHRLDHRVTELSGGEQQRVAVARALVNDPTLLLADEPTGNLDARTSAAIHELLCELNTEKGTTLVVVTHNRDLAGLMGRQVTVVDGRVETFSG